MLPERLRLTVYDEACAWCEHDTTDTVLCRYGASGDLLPIGSGEKVFRTLLTRLQQSGHLPATFFLGHWAVYRREPQDVVRVPRRYRQDGDL